MLNVVLLRPIFSQDRLNNFILKGKRLEELRKRGKQSFSSEASFSEELSVYLDRELKEFETTLLRFEQFFERIRKLKYQYSKEEEAEISCLLGEISSLKKNLENSASNEEKLEEFKTKENSQYKEKLKTLKRSLKMKKYFSPTLSFSEFKEMLLLFKECLKEFSSLYAILSQLLLKYPLKEKKKEKRNVRRILITLSLLLTLSSSYENKETSPSYKLNNPSFSHINFLYNSSSSKLTVSKAKEAFSYIRGLKKNKQGFISFLLLGRDARGFLTDSIVQILVDPYDGKTLFIGVSRDIIVKSQRRGTLEKLNALAGYERDEQATARAVEEITGQNSTLILDINLNDFTSLFSSLLGGDKFPEEGLEIEFKKEYRIPYAGKMKEYKGVSRITSLEEFFYLLRVRSQGQVKLGNTWASLSRFGDNGRRERQLEIINSLSKNPQFLIRCSYSSYQWLRKHSSKNNLFPSPFDFGLFFLSYQIFSEGERKKINTQTLKRIEIPRSWNPSKTHIGIVPNIEKTRNEIEVFFNSS